jgi:hypothetical protein
VESYTFSLSRNHAHDKMVSYLCEHLCNQCIFFPYLGLTVIVTYNAICHVSQLVFGLLLGESCRKHYVLDLNLLRKAAVLHPSDLIRSEVVSCANHGSIEANRMFVLFLQLLPYQPIFLSTEDNSLDSLLAAFQ